MVGKKKEKEKKKEEEGFIFADMKAAYVSLIFIAVGGSIGALLRYGLASLVSQQMGGRFPWGTLTVNLLGAFCIGILWQLTERALLSAQARAFLATGVLGAFTTFSTFGLETTVLIRGGEWKVGLANVLISNVVGVAAVFGGFALTRLVVDFWRS